MNEVIKDINIATVELDHLAIKVRARGRFNDKDALDFVPTPESPLLLIDTPNYDGPLDLLLHLIRKHSMDIFDIPIGLILERYLLALDEMAALNLDVAGEFLMMAAMLAEIKSKMLLPKEERVYEDVALDAEIDPRAELVRKLLIYRSFRDASLQLMALPIKGREYFFRGQKPSEEAPVEREAITLTDLKSIPIYDLLDSLAKALKKSTPDRVHTVTKDRISVSARINDLMDFCQIRTEFSFFDALKFFPVYEKIDVIVTFLALLEMSRLHLLRISARENVLMLQVVKENFYAQSKDLNESQRKDVDEDYG